MVTTQHFEHFEKKLNEMSFNELAHKWLNCGGVPIEYAADDVEFPSREDMVADILFFLAGRLSFSTSKVH